MVLRNHRQPLIKQILEAVVVRLDEEGAPPQVRSLVPDRMDKADELIGRQGGVMRRGRSTEESYRPFVLEKHCTEAQ